MRLFGLMPVKNEADRYLDFVVQWSLGFLDDLLVYDDQSTDASRDIAERRGARVVTREPGTPAFLEHEGYFRQAAYANLVRCFSPGPGDWIFAIDADEVVISAQDERSTIEANIANAESKSAVAVLVPVPEVWYATDDDGVLRDPHVRTDGLWPTIAGTRLFAYRPGGEYRLAKMGCGAEPTYVAQGRHTPAVGLYLMHYGYAADADQKAKWARYGSIEHGHLDAHVRSINEPPRLEPWTGPHTAIWRGERSVGSVWSRS